MNFIHNQIRLPKKCDGAWTEKTTMTKTVLVAGASRGIGLEMAVQYASEDWRVIAGCRNPEQARRWLPPGVDLQVLDVRRADLITALAQHVGETSLDLLILSAGLYGPETGFFAAPTEEAFDEVMHTNVLGAMRLIEALAPAVCRAHGVIAVLSSRMGSISEASDSQALLYRCSKAALNMVTKTAAVEFGLQGATVVGLHPGWVRTDMGGPEATLGVTEAVEPLRQLIADLQPRHNGRFIDHTGRELDW